MMRSDKDWDAFKQEIQKEQGAAASSGHRSLCEWLVQTEAVIDDLRSGIAEHKSCDVSLLEAIESWMLCEIWEASRDDLIGYDLPASSPVQRVVILWALDGLTPGGLDDLHTEVTLEQLAED